MGMILVQRLLTETQTSEARFVRVYHGGANIRFPSDLRVQKPRKGRFESGVGINCTTSYETARSYGRYVGLFHLEPPTLSDAVEISEEETVAFLEKWIGATSRNKILADLERARRRGRSTIYASTLLNLFVNNEVGGKNGMYLNDFLVEHGVDASLSTNCRGVGGDYEDWLVIHNPRVVKKITQIRTADVPKNAPWYLPRLREQMAF